MNAMQLDLFQQPKLPDDPDARQLVNYLFTAGAWRTRADIERDLGMDDRQIRAARDAAGSLVIIGHLGFKHALIATAAERGKHLDFFRKQGKGMLHIMARDAAFFRTLGCEVLAADP
ncbi:MAG: hypothetical protein GX595_12190, partial [Lentisphaerae bacterium]|nr:hypothetical protein [Lentisphaerota bacterium]